MLIDLLPDPNPWLVIAGVLAWDVATIAAIWLFSRPPRAARPRVPKLIRHVEPDEKDIVHVHRDGGPGMW